MTAQEIYEEISSGEWVHTLVNRMGYAFRDEDEMDNFARRASIHFQELFESYIQTLSQEEAEEALEVQRVTELINQNPELAVPFKEKGWKVTKRTNKKVDMDGFIEDYGEEIPRDAIAVVKSKLTPHLKKELTKYESITGYTFSAKR